MFEHLDDPWSFEEPLTEVETVRKRGRRMQVRRQLASLGTTATAIVMLFGAASFAGIGANDTPDTLQAGTGPGVSTAESGDPTTTTVAAATEVAPADVLTTTSLPAAVTPGPNPGTPGDSGSPSNPGPGTETPPPAGTPTPDPGTDPGPENPAPPSDVVVAANKDSYLSTGYRNTNFGATHAALVSPQADGVVGFDVRAVDRTRVVRATLRVTVCSTGPSAPAEQWPQAGGTVGAFRLRDGWEHWAHGAGVGNPGSDTGAGMTWNSAVDPDLAGGGQDCTPYWMGAGSHLGGGHAGTSGVVNGIGDGTTIDFDVTAELQSGLGPIDQTYVTFFVRKTSANGGSVSFYSIEGAAARANPALAPQLIITQSN